MKYEFSNHLLKKRCLFLLLLKRQRWKTLCLLKHEGKREFRRFSRAYAAPACSDQVQMESLLTFFVHQIEKGFSFDTYQYGRGRGALRNIADLSARLIEADAQWRDKSIYKAWCLLWESIADAMWQPIKISHL